MQETYMIDTGRIRRKKEIVYPRLLALGLQRMTFSILCFLHVGIVHVYSLSGFNGLWGAWEQPPRGTPWVSGLVGHFVLTWPDSECSHTVQFLGACHNSCTIGCDQSVVRAKKFAICLWMFTWKKMLVRKHAPSEAPVGDRFAMICNRSCIYFTSWCVRCATKASVGRWSDSIVRVIRWSVDGSCVNMIECMVNVRLWEPSCVCSYVSLGVAVVWYSAYAPFREEVLVQ